MPGHANDHADGSHHRFHRRDGAYRQTVRHAIVDLGYIPWFLMMVGIFWIGIRIENNDRKKDGREPYSAYEAGQEVREYFHTSTPYILLGMLAVALLIRHLGL